jgi:hypothetical protein
MALLFVDSFDHYATAALLQKYTQMSGGTAADPTIGAYGRRSTNGVRWSTTNDSGKALRKVIGASGATAIIGFSFVQTGAFSGLHVSTNASFAAQSNIVCMFLQGGTNQVWVRINSTGTLSVLRGSTVLGTTTNALSVGVTYYIELKVLLHDSTGTVGLRVDGVSWLSLTGQDTVNTSSATWDEFAFGHVSSNLTTITWSADDLYVADGSGSDLNDFAGDVRIDVCQPTADGAATSFTPSTGADNYAMVDEAEADGDTTYNESTTVNHIDSFTTENAPSSAAIIAVAVTVQARKTDAGASTIAGLTRISGTDYPGSNQATPSSYAFHQQIWENSPATSVAWTTAEFDGAEFGYKKTA